MWANRESLPYIVDKPQKIFPFECFIVYGMCPCTPTILQVCTTKLVLGTDSKQIQFMCVVLYNIALY